MTPQEIRDAVDAQFAPYLPEVISRQTDYFTENGEYFQGLQVPLTVPADGVAIPPTFPPPPTDQVAAWTPADFPEDMVGAIRIDTYNATCGKGFLVVLAVEIDGDLWQQIGNFGCDATMAKAWHIVDDGGI